MLQRVALLIVAAGCASSGLPHARATDPEVCVDANAASAAVHGIITDGQRAELCYGVASCIMFEVATSTVSAAQLAASQPEAPERFELSREEDGITLCDRQTDLCSTVRIPGTDPRTVLAEANATGTELYALVSTDDGVHTLDTFDLRSRRIGRIVLGHGTDRWFTMVRVGNALLVGESINADAGTSPPSSTMLVAPFTGAIRHIASGSAIELDATSILAIEGRSAVIVEARALRPIASYTAPGPHVPDHSSASGVRIDSTKAIVAFSDPPSVATIDIPKRRFVSAVRLPVCAPIKSDYVRPPAPIMNE